MRVSYQRTAGRVRCPRGACAGPADRPAAHFRRWATWIRPGRPATSSWKARRVGRPGACLSGNPGRRRLPARKRQRCRVMSATQSPSIVQRIIASVLGLPMNRVEVDVLRLGGGFGGKEDQATPWAVMAALARAALQRPVKMVLAAARTCAATGKRHPYDSDFRIGLDAAGNILAYEVDLLPERRRRRRPVDRHPGAHPVPRHQQLPHPQRARHRHLLPHQPAALHRFPRLRRAAGHVCHRGGHFPGRGKDGRRAGRRCSSRTCSRTATSSPTARRRRTPAPAAACDEAVSAFDLEAARASACATTTPPTPQARRGWP